MPKASKRHSWVGLYGTIKFLSEGREYALHKWNRDEIGNDGTKKDFMTNNHFTCKDVEFDSPRGFLDAMARCQARCQTNPNRLTQNQKKSLLCGANSLSGAMIHFGAGMGSTRSRKISKVMGVL